MNHGDTSAKDVIIAAALAGGSTHASAARAAGVSERTVRRRLSEPSFQRELTRARDELVSHISDRLTGLTSVAVDALNELVLSADTPPAVRLRAALGVLTAHGSWRDSTILENRLQVLEAMATVDERDGAPA